MENQPKFEIFKKIIEQLDVLKNIFIIVCSEFLGADRYSQYVSKTRKCWLPEQPRKNTNLRSIIVDPAPASC